MTKVPASGRDLYLSRNKEEIGHSYSGWIWDKENPNADIHVREATPQDESLWATVLKMREAYGNLLSSNLYKLDKMWEYSEALTNAKEVTAEFDRVLKEMG